MYVYDGLNTFYQVTITNSGLATSNTASGFVDHLKAEDYMALGQTPSTLQAGIDKERGNVRFKNVVEKLQSMGTIYYSNANAVGATVNTAATSFTMTLLVEHGDSSLITRDDANAKVEITGTDALKRCIARGLTEERLNWNAEVIDQTKSAGFRDGAQANAIARVGSRVMLIDVGALTNSIVTAESAITVVRPDQ
jgi:hypothetical protein